MSGIAVCDLTRCFGDQTVLAKVSLDIPRGETFTLTGPNGGGKTTLIELLATLLTPSSGRASVGGFDVVRQPDRVRTLIGYAPSALHSFYPRLTGKANLQFFAALKGLPSSEGRAQTDRLLSDVGLSSAAATRVDRYSDGMRARLVIARALLGDPAILLLDEPTKSIDARSRSDIRGVLTRARANGEPRTILWITHDAQEAATVGHRGGELDHGVLREVAPLGERGC
jgi:ABC-type multidrug transport system ATPase subunit